MPKAIEVKDLSIIYRTINPISVKGLSKTDGKRSAFYKAVNNVSFEVERGEILGVIGQNGGGKSTLLRAVAGIFSPDSGSINIFDQSISLLAIGVGFQPHLTGRVNIMLSGLLLGFTEKEINERIGDIIAFAELGDFIDKPVRTYSSGMYSKLAFAITATLETQIMLVDEVLSVGDARFKQKSFNRMRELITDDDRTVMIVSHELETIRDLCDRVLWIEKGETKMIGQTADVLDQYNKFIQDNLKK